MAQALAVHQGFAVDEFGNVLPSATVRVVNSTTGALAALYDDRLDGSSIGNSFTAEADGSFRFYVASGRYHITWTLGDYSLTFPDVAIGTAAEYDASVFGGDNNAAARVATTANITIATALNNGDTLNGVSLVTGDRVLVKDQTTKAQNGVYVVGASPARASDFDAYDDHAGTRIAVTAGTVGAGRVYFGAVNAGGTIDVTDIVFAEAGPIQKLELDIIISGSAPLDGEIVEGKLFASPMSFLAGFPGSRASARAVATGSSVFNILKNGVSIGTVTFAPASPTGTVSAASAQAFVAGDQLDIECPDPADVTLAGIKITLLCA